MAATGYDYLDYDEIVAINREVITTIKAKKADAFKVLGALKIRNALEAVESAKGDVYDKAVVLLEGLVQEHPFASGNRRTAVVATIRFLRANGIEPTFKEDAKILQGIRESYYSHDEIKKWLKGGDMREFKR